MSNPSIPHWGDAAVLAYLQAHADFFDRHPQALLELQLKQGGGTTSLLEKQVQKLREENHRLKNQLHNLTQIAQDNTQLFERMQQLIHALVLAEDAANALQVITRLLQEVFAIEEVVIISWKIPKQPLPLLRQLGVQDHWMQVLKNELKLGEPRCGKVEDKWQTGLFQRIQPQSMCLLPLGSSQVWGALALGDSAQRYDESQGTLFLKQLADLVTLKLGSAFYD